MQIVIDVRESTVAVLTHMARVRRLPVSEIAAHILNAECESAVVVQFDSKVPGALRSKGR